MCKVWVKTFISFYWHASCMPSTNQSKTTANPWPPWQNIFGCISDILRWFIKAFQTQCEGSCTNTRHASKALYVMLIQECVYGAPRDVAWEVAEKVSWISAHKISDMPWVLFCNIQFLCSIFTMLNQCWCMLMFISTYAHSHCRMKHLRSTGRGSWAIVVTKSPAKLPLLICEIEPPYCQKSSALSRPLTNISFYNKTFF